MTNPSVYYDCRDSERFTHETEEDAIVEFLELFMTPGCDSVAVIREHSPIEVTKYQRATITDGWISSEADLLLEKLAEDYAEDELADPDGGDNGLTPQVLKAALPAMEALIRKVMSHAVVWHCERVSSRMVEADEVEAMMRLHAPTWFEEGAP